MKAFKILDKNQNAISINQLDKDICELLNIDYSDKQYCKLGKRSDCKNSFEYACLSNWFDVIGWQIANGKSFQDIIDDYTKSFEDFIGQPDEDGTIITLERILPYHMAILNMWIDNEYIPISIN